MHLKGLAMAPYKLPSVIFYRSKDNPLQGYLTIYYILW